MLPRPSPLAGTLLALSERGLNAAGDIRGSDWLLPLVIFGIVMGSIYGGLATPTEASAMGAAGALNALVAVRNSTPTRSLRRPGRTT